MKIFRVVLMIFCLGLLSQKVNAESFVLKPGDSFQTVVGQMVIKISNHKSEHTVVVINQSNDQIKMFLDFILPGFKMGMSFDEFGGKKVSIACEKKDIKLEIN